MEMIEAVIKPEKLEAVITALATLSILGATAFEVKGYGRQAGHTERFRGGRMDVGFVPKLMLRICVKDCETEPAIYKIRQAARSGHVGDGKVFVRPVTRVVRIRTGDEDEKAL